MKEKVKPEYLRRVRKFLEAKLNGGNKIKGINTWAVSLLKYSTAFIDWNCTELTQLDRITRKLMTMHDTLHPKSNVDRLNIPRKEGGRGLQDVKETVKLTNLGLENYVKESRERLLATARSVDINLMESIQETAIETRKQKKEERTISSEEKMLHGQFVRQNKEVGNQDRWQWLRNWSLKCETESLIFAAQEQAIRTNVIKGKIDKSQEQTKCRMCSKADETINHIVSECAKLAQREYKRRHDWVGRRIHWGTCGANGIHVKSK